MQLYSQTQTYNLSNGNKLSISYQFDKNGPSGYKLSKQTGIDTVFSSEDEALRTFFREYPSLRLARVI